MTEKPTPIVKTLKGCFYLLLVLPVTVLVLVVVLFLALLKFLLPVQGVQTALAKLLVGVCESWVGLCGWWYRCVHRPNWQISGLEGLSRDQWYLVIGNHQSWSDIPILLFAFNRRIQPCRFFVKRQLLWAPLIGQACWALEFPFMRRYSREQLLQNPELRERDLNETRRFCKKLENHPATIMNYLEGTRFTLAKHTKQDSAYQHLLNPKSGGAAYVLTHLGDRIETLLDITLVYPAERIGFWTFLCGGLGSVVMRVQHRQVPEDLRAGDYLGSDAFRQRFQDWIAQIWQEKDALISTEKAAMHPERITPK